MTVENSVCQSVVLEKYNLHFGRERVDGSEAYVVRWKRSGFAQRVFTLYEILREHCLQIY